MNEVISDKLFTKRGINMSDHYFKENPTSHHDQQVILFQFKEKQLSFMTDSGIFSKHRVDYGSRLLLNMFSHYRDLKKEQYVLELGSGYGPIAISLGNLYPNAHIVGIEINQRAYQLALDNTRRNHTTNVEFEHRDVYEFKSNTRFDYVLTNPPIRAGKPIIQKFVEVSYDNLKEEGQLWLVIQKKQGAPSMKKYMLDIFGNVEKIHQDKGYWILVSKKNEY